MHFICLIVSKRRRGNSEILGKLALKYAIEQGAEVEIVYLRDYRIEECEGCMGCVFKGKLCHLDDDTYKLFDKILSADALFLVSPTYVLGVPGILKLVIDKYLIVPNYYNKIYGRPAMSVGIGGLLDWNHFELPMLNLFLLGFGFRVVDSFNARGAGPGEVLLSEETLSRVKKGVHNIINFEFKPFESQISNHCPVCFSTIFERIEGKRYSCPVCAVEGEEMGNGYYFSAEILNNHRWTPPNIEDHFNNWICKTRDRFKKYLREIDRCKNELGL